MVSSAGPGPDDDEAGTEDGSPEHVEEDVVVGSDGDGHDASDPDHDSVAVADDHPDEDAPDDELTEAEDEHEPEFAELALDEPDSSREPAGDDYESGSESGDEQDEDD